MGFRETIHIWIYNSAARVTRLRLKNICALISSRNEDIQSWQINHQDYLRILFLMPDSSLQVSHTLYRHVSLCAH
jgi:hypothetical protein